MKFVAELPSTELGLGLDFLNFSRTPSMDQSSGVSVSLGELGPQAMACATETSYKGTDGLPEKEVEQVRAQSQPHLKLEPQRSPHNGSTESVPVNNAARRGEAEAQGPGEARRRDTRKNRSRTTCSRRAHRRVHARHQCPRGRQAQSRERDKSRQGVPLSHASSSRRSPPSYLLVEL